MASRFCVPASVRSKPGPPTSSRCSRNSSGPLPGFGGVTGGGVVPAQPARPGQVGDQVQRVVGPVEELDGEELPVARRAGDDPPDQRLHRRVEGLDRAHRRDVHARDRAVEGVLAQVVRERLDLGQLGHGLVHRLQRTVGVTRGALGAQAAHDDAHLLPGAGAAPDQAGPALRGLLDRSRPRSRRRPSRVCAATSGWGRTSR